MKKITIWKIIEVIEDEEGNKTAVASHNHIEDGHVDGTFPQPLDQKFKNQRSWKNHEWQKEFAYLDENHKVIL